MAVLSLTTKPLAELIGANRSFIAAESLLTTG